MVLTSNQPLVSSPVIANATITNTALVNGSSIVSTINDHWSFVESNNDLVLGVDDLSSGEVDVYVVEKWQSKKPIEVGNGLYVSFEEDLYTKSEIQEMVYAKIEEEYPEKAIKLDLNKDNLTIRKLSLPIEIKMKEQ